MLGAACPVKPAPTGLRNAGLTILPDVERQPMLLTRRAGCHESGSSSSREALTSNPFPCLEGVIREFYPMVADVAEVGRRRRTSSRIARQVCERISSEAVAAKAGVIVQQVAGQLNPVQGDRGPKRLVQPGFRGESAFGDECSRSLNQASASGRKNRRRKAQP